MSVERDRLLSLIEFSQQSARLRDKPAASVAGHRLFSLFEHELIGLPGVRVNRGGSEAEDEIWLSVERLAERRPPDVKSPHLQPWIQLTQGPAEEPRLRAATAGSSLIAAGTHASSLDVPPGDLPLIAPDAIVVFSEYEMAAVTQSALDSYVARQWRPWAEEERLRRKTIRLYADLFTLKQQLEGSIVEAALELVWGVGIGVWTTCGTSVSYPLITRPVEL